MRTHYWQTSIVVLGASSLGPIRQMVMQTPKAMDVEHEIREVIQELVDAWNRRDWSSFSRLFAEDADYVTGAAVRLEGRGQIHDDLSSRAEISLVSGQVSLAVESLKMLGPDVAVALCRWQMGEHDTREVKDPLRAGFLTMVLRAANGGWQIVFLHNTDRAESLG